MQACRANTSSTDVVTLPELPVYDAVHSREEARRLALTLANLQTSLTCSAKVAPETLELLALEPLSDAYMAGTGTPTAPSGDDPMMDV
mmetsp:Transcript_60472/g.88547  ORF Transcript_60472/g.88547 Transcript_60472/m.88547 type:complete len:88 (-) Transcript_60472:32-295(-)